MTAIRNPIDTILSLYGGLGSERYSDGVTQEAHALQAAYLAERDGAADPLVVATLLHDIGHLLHKQGETAAERGIDARHELVGAHGLARWFGPEVVEPVHHHVAAKRYLCTAEPEYFETLSPASVRSLKLQGGPFTATEAALFIGRRHADDAVRLRRWDEQAKVPGAEVPPFEHFLARIETCLDPAQMG